MALKFAEAIEGKGYDWYLDNIVNNDYGKWPLVVGSSEFDQEKFDHATVAGISILRSIRSQEKLIVLGILFVRKMSFFLGVNTRQYGQSSLIGANVGQDSKNSSRNVIYVCNNIFAKVY